ncbi:MAG: TlpA family protein disulfide reductase [Flavobacteriaceae bacterium]
MKFFILLTTLFISNIILAQHTIKGVFTPAKSYTVLLLYKSAPTLSDYVTNATVKEDGSFEFVLDTSATKGMYKIVYAVPQEDYNFDIIYNGKENIELSFNAETGVKHLSSSENKLLSTYTADMLAITHNITAFYKDKKGKQKTLASIFKTQRETQEKFEKLAQGTIALNFIKANKPYIPTGYQEAKTYIKNLETHYFDHVDFTNETLQSSNFLEERMLNYIFGITNDNLSEDANYKANIDAFCKAMQQAPTPTKRVLLVSLWQQFSDLKQETIANYIAERYLITIAKTLKDNQLIEALSLYKRISLGEKAPDFSFEIENKKDEKPITTKLSALNTAKYYVVLFWSSTCSHCLTEVPKVEQYIKTQSKGKVKVVAVGLEDEPYAWKSLTYDFPDFIHVYGQGKWDNQIGNNYGITSTPTYFVLDKDKHIIAKPESLEALKSVLNSVN